MLCRDPRSLALKLSLVLVSLCAAASTVLSAPQSQQTTAQSAENKQAAPPLRVTAHLVQANVIVNDKHGNPITGLSQKDFTILDNGNQQEIRVFAAQTNHPSVPSRTTPLPLSTHTNRPEEQTNTSAASLSFSWTHSTRNPPTGRSPGSRSFRCYSKFNRRNTLPLTSGDSTTSYTISQPTPLCFAKS